MKDCEFEIKSIVVYTDHSGLRAIGLPLPNFRVTDWETYLGRTVSEDIQCK